MSHAHGRQHSFPGAARQGLPHHDITWAGCALLIVCQKQRETPARRRAEIIDSINQWLEEPIEDCLAVARDGDLCIESKSPVDIEQALGMYHGNIFQDAPTFPFAERKEQAGNWGVETEYENVFLCGSSAYRGGAVSGIPGHNAAMKVLETISNQESRSSENFVTSSEPETK